MATGFSFERYNEEVEEWGAYLERLEQFFEFKEVETEKKKATLITMLGAKLYGTLRSLCQPLKPAEKTYPELVTLLTDHLNPKPSIYTERSKFHSAYQKEGETISQFIARLKALTARCEFGSNLSEILRDRVVCGLRSERAKQRLLAENTLTLESVIKIATTWEASFKEALDLTEERKVQNGGQCNSVNWKKKVPSNEDKGTRWRKPSEGKTASTLKECFCCGKQGHWKSDCRYRNYNCNVCKLKGHIARMCKRKDSVKQKPVDDNVKEKKWQRSMTGVEEREEKDICNEQLFKLTRGNDRVVGEDGKNIFQIELMIEGKKIAMEIDTGSSNSVISKSLYLTHFSDIKLRVSDMYLKYYTGEKLFPLGYLVVTVNFKQQCKKLRVYVIDGGGPPLVGKDWIEQLGIIKWEENLNNMSQEDILKELSEKFKEVFEETLGTYRYSEGVLRVKEGTQPKFCKARPIPFALKEKVEEELNRLIRLNVLKPIEFSHWATPIVPVLKANGTVRICGDYKITLNPGLEIDKYPVPRVEELFARLGGGKLFTKIDLSQAYQQVKLNEESKALVTINTHRGLFQYQRVPYGIASAPGIFQRIMDQLVQGIPGVVTFLDDILIMGKNENEHLCRVNAVLERLQKAGLRVQKQKCAFFRESISFLGHVIDSNGLHTSKEKVEAIVRAPEPKDVKQLQSIVGLINYYGRFVPNISTILSPLYELLKKDKEFVFNVKCKEAFSKVKEILGAAPVLAHYDPECKLRLTCDASAYGIGAILSQICKDGKERPVAFGSRTLSETEKKYSSLDREALALYWGVKKFYQYLYGKEFVLVTDHKPLVTIFGPKRGIPQIGACRLQRYAWFLAEFVFKIEYIKSVNNQADALSRLPMCEDYIVREDASYLNFIEEAKLPISSKDIQSETIKDEELQKVLVYLNGGWPKKLNKEKKIMEPYFRRREELNVEQGVIMWGYRVVVPQKFRKKLLQELHESHFGMVKMKAGARSYFWWPGLDQEIERLVENCIFCNRQRRNPPKGPVHVWDNPMGPFRRIHVDFLGPYQGKIFLLVTDAFSKWIEAFEVKSTSGEQVIPRLRGLFAQFGLPEHLVSDNGPPFTSEVFKKFVQMNGIRHTFSPPYHPASNGLAENHVKTFKHKVTTAISAGMEIHLAVHNFLLTYRTTPHCTTGETPAKLFLGRPLRTRLDMLRPSLGDNVQKEWEGLKGKEKGRDKKWSVGEKVWAKDFRRKEVKWSPGTVEKVLGPVTYVIKTEENLSWKRHMNQLWDNRAKEAMGECERTEETETAGQEGYESSRVAEEQAIMEKVVAGVKDHSEGHPGDLENKVTEKVFQGAQSVRRYPLRDRVKKRVIDV